MPCGMTGVPCGTFQSLRKPLAPSPSWKPRVDNRGECLHAADVTIAILSLWTCSLDSHLFIFHFSDVGGYLRAVLCSRKHYFRPKLL